MKEATYDVLAMGRSSIDLYSNDIGAPFHEITSFAAYVGGSPLNIAVGAQRLGARTALLTALGADPVGDFIQHFLDKEGVETAFIPRKPLRRTSAVLLGIEPPDRFPLVYYRSNCADIALTMTDVEAAPVEDCKVFEFAGTNLSGQPSRGATGLAAKMASDAGATVVLDVDFRPDQWERVEEFGKSIQFVLQWVDIVIGTTDELNATAATAKESVGVTDSQVSDARVEGDTSAIIAGILKGRPRLVVEKVGSRGARIHSDGGRSVQDVPGFPVEVANVLGAGDAFGAGFIYGLVHGWAPEECARLGNACGAHIVKSHGCANFMPSLEEAMAIMRSA